MENTQKIKNIIDNTDKVRLNLIMENIIPVEKENIGIRAEIKFLAEKMEHGFTSALNKFCLILI